MPTPWWVSRCAACDDGTAGVPQGCSLGAVDRPGCGRGAPAHRIRRLLVGMTRSGAVAGFFDLGITARTVPDRGTCPFGVRQQEVTPSSSLPPSPALCCSPSCSKDRSTASTPRRATPSRTTSAKRRSVQTSSRVGIGPWMPPEPWASTGRPSSSTSPSSSRRPCCTSGCSYSSRGCSQPAPGGASPSRLSPSVSQPRPSTRSRTSPRSSPPRQPGGDQPRRGHRVLVDRRAQVRRLLRRVPLGSGGGRDSGDPACAGALQPRCSDRGYPMTTGGDDRRPWSSEPLGPSGAGWAASLSQGVKTTAAVRSPEPPHGVRGVAYVVTRNHTADRPVPCGLRSPSSFSSLRTSRMVGSLIPGSAALTSEIAKTGAPCLRTCSRTRSDFVPPDLSAATPSANRA